MQRIYRIRRFCLVVFLLLPLPSLAEDEPRLTKDDDELPTLFISQGSKCEEDYVGELKRSGIEVSVRTLASLKGMAKFLGVPSQTEVRHLLLLNGIAFVNHVSPAVISATLSKPTGIKGLIGSSVCPAGDDHTAIHDPVTQF